MLFVKVPKEIKEYEEKLVLGLSTRQILWGVLAIVSSLISFFGFKFIVGEEFASWITMFIGIPMFACGFLDYQGMPMSKFLKIVWNYYRKKQILTYDNGFPQKEVNYEKEITKKRRKIARNERKKLVENQED